MKTVKYTILGVLFFMMAVSLFADGGGGVFWQNQTDKFPFAPEWHLTQDLADLKMVGGFGYGIDNHGGISGGFGYGIVSEYEGEGAIAGGFGGVINGFRILHNPIHLAVVSYLGFGGIAIQGAPGEEEEGYFAVSLELDVELGLPMGWLMPVVYAGYQYIGNILPGDSFSLFQTYGPVLGCRVAFGDF